MIKLIFRFFLLLTLLLLTVGAIIFSFRENLLMTLVEKAERRINDAYGLSVTVAKAEFNGLSTICLSGVLVSYPNGDTLLHIDSTAFHPDWFSVIKSQPVVEDFFASQARLYLDMTDSGTRISGIFNSKKIKNVQLTDYDLGFSLNRTLGKLFAVIPQFIQIDELQVGVKTDSSNSEVSFNRFVSDRGFLH
ncbi:MAG: hypothetical protein ACKOA1_04870, partial [Bacteroidota bacterium]